MPSLASRSERPAASFVPTAACAPSMTIDPQLRQNHLLKALPDAVWERLSAELELVELAMGTCLLHEGAAVARHVYFPTNSIISLLCVVENGASAQTAMVGVEGMVGLPLFMEGETSPSRAVVQSTGYAFKLPARLLAQEFEHTPAVTRLLIRYTHSLITQMAQAAVCNRHHSIEQQVCRWLLSSLDRISGNKLVMTHDFLSGMIGARREGVTEAACRLQRLGMISYSRGRITVLDRPALEAHACECYAVVRCAAGQPQASRPT